MQGSVNPGKSPRGWGDHRVSKAAAAVLLLNAMCPSNCLLDICVYTHPLVQLLSLVNEVLVLQWAGSRNYRDSTGQSAVECPA